MTTSLQVPSHSHRATPTTRTSHFWKTPIAPTNVVAALNTGATAVDVTWGLPKGNYEQIFDDGIAENFTVWATAGNRNAVKFTPVGYPATVLGGKVNIGTVNNYPSGCQPAGTLPDRSIRCNRSRRHARDCH